MSASEKRKGAIAYLSLVAIPALERSTDDYDDQDKAWDAYIREWRKLPKRPRLRKPYEGLFGKGTAVDLRQQAKAVAEAIKNHLASLQMTSPVIYTESDYQTDSFIRQFEKLDSISPDSEPYEGMESLFAKLPPVSIDTTLTTKPQAQQKQARITLPAFNGGNAIATRQAIIKECERQGLVLPTQHAYILATVQHETADTWQPVREAFWKNEEWRSRNLWYYPYYGRGYVQITHKENYAKYEKILGLPLVEQPDLVMRPDIALFILVHGSKHGIFTGVGIEQYIHRSLTDYINARRVINGTDRASHIAALAEAWYGKIIVKRLS